MRLGDGLKQRIPRSLPKLDGSFPSSLAGALRRVSPFVFPWSPLVRTTGAIVTENGLKLTRGTLKGRFFEIDERQVIAAADIEAGTGAARRRGAEPVFVCLPRSRSLLRHFRVPSESETEIETMLPHLLAGELPTSVEHFAWAWRSLPCDDEGYSLVAVCLAREDLLMEFIEPLLAAGANVVGLVPEGWCVAHALREPPPDDGCDEPDESGEIDASGDAGLSGEVGEAEEAEEGEAVEKPWEPWDPDAAAEPEVEDEPAPAAEPVEPARAVVIPGESNPCLVVTRGGRLLFDTVLPGSVLLEPAGDPEAGAWRRDWEIFHPAMPEIKKAQEDAAVEDRRQLDPRTPHLDGIREHFAELFGFAMPEPVYLPGGVAGVDDEANSFGATVAAVGLESERLLVPKALGDATKRRMLSTTLGVLGRLALVALVVWIGCALVEESRARSYLRSLADEMVEDAPRVEAIEAEFNAIRENAAMRSGDTEILKVLACLRRKVKSPVYLEHLDYARGRGVTLRGGATQSVSILQMTDDLASDPLWDGLRVMHLRTEQTGRTQKVHFVVSGQIREIQRNSSAERNGEE